jgi:Tfp pilus assembly protein PilN
VKTIQATIPLEVEEPREWVSEHVEKLLPLPVAHSELAFTLQPIESGPSGLRALITFVRKSDVEETLALFEAAGLELLSLGAGEFDLLSALLVSDKSSAAKSRVHIAQVSPCSFTLLSASKGRCVGLWSRPLSSTLTRDEAMEKAHELDKERADDTLISGRVDLGGLPGKMFQPFGLESRFALAAGLAVRGFLPGIKSVEFLSQERAEKHKSTLARSLLNRTVLVCGVLTLLLLVLPFLASLYVEERTSELDEELARSGESSAQLTTLERRVSYLKASLGGSPKSASRSDLAELLHEIARLVPDHVELQRITIETKGSATELMHCMGRSSSREGVEDLLRNLRTSPLIKDVSVTNIAQKEVTSPERRSTEAGIVDFDIELGLNPGSV